MNRTGLAAILLLTASFASGCSCSCCRKGIVLRGDWSLELNRVKHLQTNSPQYSGDCDACDDFGCSEVVPGGCVDGCTSNCPHGGSSAGSGCRAGLSHRRGGEFYDEFHDGSGGHGDHMPEPPQPTPATQTRFHPVPTKPVFEPEYGPELMEPGRPTAAANAGWKSKRRA